MDENQLARLRDIAIEYYPPAQKVRERAKIHYPLDSSRYSLQLWSVSVGLSTYSPTLTAVERAAARLLSALEAWVNCDPYFLEVRNQIVYEQYSEMPLSDVFDKLADAVKML